jgi:N-acyl-D-aspartate/D-glutamate deacylase
MADLVIRGASVCDGTGEPPFPADVAVSGGRIDAVGGGIGRAATEVDGDGLVLAPGFIDLHTHYDCQLFWDPSASPSPWHGVTTVVMGNCGFTIAPCREGDRDTLMRLLRYVEGMPIDTLRAGIRWAWDDFDGYLGALERQGVGPNVAAFIGHSAVRYRVMGAAAVERAATAKERGAMAAAVQQGMRAGAIGWSTSLSPTHFFGDGTPAPSRLAEREELLALAQALADFERGVIEIAPRSTVGAPDDKAAEQRDLLAALARASGKVVSWAPLLDNQFAPGSAQAILAEAAALQADGVQVVPQVGPRPLELRFDFAEPAFFLEQVPFWRPIMAKPRDERRRMFADAEFRAELERQGGHLAVVAQSWDQLVLRLAATDGTRRWQDRSVAEIAAGRGQAPLDAFCDVVLEDDLEAQWGIVILNGDETGVAALLRSPAALVALSDAGAHVDTLCDQGFTTYLLGHWVRERGVLALEEAVQLITTVPAERYGLRGRGRVAPGWAADLVLFDPRRIATRPTEMVHDLPRAQRRLLQRAVGVEWVFVNGVPLVERGVPMERRPGRVLRGGV